MDKNSAEWQEYCKGLLEFDEIAGPYFAIPSTNNSFDMVGYFKTVREKYNGNSDLMPQEEKDSFMIAEHRKTA